MGLWQKLVRSISIFTIFSAFMLFAIAPMAHAQDMSELGMPEIERAFEANVKGGSFTVDTTFPVKTRLRVGKAVVSLPKNETGTIDSLSITDANGEREYFCEGLKVKNGTDLIVSCGGPAYLETGKTTYQAKGSNFKPNPNVTLGITLSAEISDRFVPNS